VVDNGSTDGSIEMLRAGFADLVEVVTLPENRGYAEAMNIGMAAARGEYYLALNNDAVAAPGWAAALVAAADGDERTGMCASKILNAEDRTLIDNTGHLLYRDGLNRGRGRLERDTGQWDTPGEALFPSGCAALYRRRMIEEIGTYDAAFFAYGDDTDIGLRGRIAGWRCLYVPAAVVYHHYSATAGSYSAFKAFHVERNRAWIAIKYFPLRYLLASPGWTLARFALQAWGAVTGKGAAGRFAADQSKPALLAVLVRAYASAAAGLPLMLRERRLMGRIRRTGAADFGRWFREFGMSAREIALKD
jgi:GT2 family glycosyltransferase